MIKFLLMVNKQGQTRLANYYDWLTIEERNALESEIIRKCLARAENQCSFMEYRGMKIIYRRYASLFFICGVDTAEEEVRTVLLTPGMAAFSRSPRLPRAPRCRRARSPSPPPPPSPPQNELGVLEFIHALVETLDKYFENVCELDIMFNLEKAHFILDEMVTNGCVVETNKGNVLKPILLLEKISAGK